MYEIMDKQVGLSADALNFVKQSYAENQVRQKALDDMTLKTGNSLLEDAATNRARGKEQYDFYMEKGRPVVEQVLNDAKNYDSEANIDSATGRASADVAQSFGQAEQGMTRNLSRMGVMPNASRMAAISSNLAIQKAAAQAGAMTNAENATRTTALNMRAGAANMANGMPNTAIALGSAGQSAGQAAMGNQIASNGQAMQGQNQVMAGYGTAGNMMGQAANTGNQIFQGQMAGYNAQQQANANSSAGLGSLVGMGASIMGLADGGTVHGPGTGVSDSVPAVNTSNGQQIKLSNGEFVIPADVVRAKGEEFFNKLLEKHHTPAAIQRRTRRV
jgi:hypothetical protein